MAVITTNIMTFTLQQQDNVGATVVQRTAGPFSYAGQAGQFSRGVLTSTTPVSVALPVTQVLQCYVKNNHTSDPITVQWTPTGGTLSTAQNLYPQGTLAFWTTSTGAGAGISALQLGSSSTGGAVQYETFLGG